MDKNMIKIDDLLKQRLANGEEKQRPGAWLQMRELLDKEMPVTQAPAAAYNWRRMMGYLAGLALLATVSVGGYQVATRMNADNNATETVSQVLNNNNGAKNTSATNNIANSNSVSINTNNNNNTPNNPSSNNNNPTTTATTASATNNSNADEDQRTSSINSVNNKTTNKTGSQTATNNHVAGNTTKGQQVKNGTTTTGIAGTSTAAKSGTAGRSVTEDKSSISTAEKNTAASTNGQLAGSTKPANNTAKEQGNTNVDNNTTAANTQRNYGAGNNSVKSLPTANTLQSNTASVKTTPAIVNSGAPAPKTSSTPSTSGVTGNGTVANNTTGGQSKSTSTGNQQLEEKTYINKIETKEKYTRAEGWKKDTIAMGKAEWHQEQPIIAKAETKAANNEIVPASSMSVTANEEKLVPLSESMVARKQTHYEKSKVFEQMVQNAKVRMGTVRFYPGAIIGGNTSVAGSSNQYGFQLGLVGNLSLNEKWGILTELKYVQRMRKDSRLDDGYITNVQNNFNGVQNMTTWDSNTHYFNYATVNSIELPIAVKYAIKRVNLFGGANLVYNFGVSNVEEVSRKESKEAPEASFNVALKNGVPTVSVADFNSRFSIGYLIGAGYQFSPALQIDLRLTQNVYDNAKTAGAKIVSKELYKAPSLQINMSYRFGNNNNRPMKAR